jgi:hypothetical protein
MLEALDAHADFVRLAHVEVLHGDPDADAVGRKMWREWATIIHTILSEAGLATREELRTSHAEGAALLARQGGLLNAWRAGRSCAERGLERGRLAAVESPTDHVLRALAELGEHFVHLGRRRNHHDRR